MKINSPANRIRAAYLFAFASLGSWMPTLTLWLQKQQVQPSAIGYIAAIPWLLMLLLQPAWGTLADRRGKKKTFLIGAALSVLLFIVLGFANASFFYIVIVSILLFIFYTPVLPLLDSIVLDYVETTGKISFSALRFWGAPGFALGAMTVSNLIELLGYNVVLYGSSFFLLICLLLIKTVPITEKNSAAGETTFTGISVITRNRILLIFLTVILLVSVAQSSSSSYLTVYLEQIGASSATTGLALGVQALSELPFYFVVVWLLKKTHASNIVLMAIAGTVLRLFLYSINGEPAMVPFIELLNGVTWTLLWIASVEYVNASVPSHHRALGQSILWAAYFGAGAVLGNIFTGSLLEEMSMRNVYGFAAGLSALTFMIASLIFFIGRRKRVYQVRTKEVEK